MTELEIARQIINQTDKEMAELFEKRMDIVLKVAQYKKDNNMENEQTLIKKMTFEEKSALLTGGEVI